MNYYNEFDKDAAAILRVLIAEGLIAPGIVDERSIEDVRPDELAGYTQCHFFAGIGIWSLALRQAGWPDDKSVWTGSCPCQPFSAAGKGDGFADERHLWPAFYHLIAQRRPADLFGEQVASKAVDPWIDLVHADLEALGYAFGSVPFPSAGVGAPHIRDRNYWCATHLDGWSVGGAGIARTMANAMQSGRAERWTSAGSGQAAGLCAAGGVADLHDDRCEARGAVRPVCEESDVEHGGTVSGLGNTPSIGSQVWSHVHGELHGDGLAEGRDVSGLADIKLQQRQNGQSGIGDEHDASGRFESAAAPSGLCSDSRPGPTNGAWRDADWLLCRDGKWRPVEPSTFPLAPAGTFRNRVAALRGAGNAINLEAAKAFIESVM